MLRGAFRQAVGCALASALAASGCAMSRAPAQMETGQADGKGADSQATDAWVQSRLDDRGRARVAAARAHAVSALRRELAFDPDATTRAALGLPDAVAALRLCSALEQSLWAA
jgi:hypothetical protein